MLLDTGEPSRAGVVCAIPPVATRWRQKRCTNRMSQQAEAPGTACEIQILAQSLLSRYRLNRPLEDSQIRAISESGQLVKYESNLSNKIFQR